MPREVKGEGPPDARIAIVGEAPGSQEELESRPFVGPSGKLLNQMLLSAGINRNSCYVTNVLKRRPPGNDFSSLYKDKSRKSPTDELVSAREVLVQELQAISPNLTIACGREPLRALTGKDGIDKWRGSILSSNNLKILPTYHPAYILRMYHHRAIVEADFKKALRHSLSPDVPVIDFRFWLDPNLDEVLERIFTLPDRFSFDIETIGRFTRCLGLAWSPRDAICIPFTKTKAGLPGPIAPRWEEAEEEAILLALRKLFSRPTARPIAQNFPFDATILYQNYQLHIEHLYIDTLLLQHCLYPELPKSLDFLTSLYTDIPRYSDYSASSDSSTWAYNATDCAVTYEVAEKLEQEAREVEVWDFYRSHVQPTMIALTRAANRGVRIDGLQRSQLKDSCEKRCAELIGRIHAAAGRELNPNSPKQMKEFLYEELNLPRRRSRTTGNTTANEEALVALRNAHPRHKAVLDPILEYRNERKMLGTFLNAKLRADDRMATSYNVSGTVNGRISSSQNIWGEGGNMQNIPKNYVRKMFMPEPGHVFIKADLSQAEVRVVAWSARIPALIERFQNEPDFDIHRWNASRIYRIPYESVSSYQRSIAKAGVHGGNYGLGPRKAAVLFGVPFPDAKRAIETYRNELPEIGRWWSEIRAQISSARELRNPFGRRRLFLGRLDDELFRSAYAFIPQSTVADIINISFSEAEERLRETGTIPIIQVHDEICFSSPDPEKAIEIIRPLIERPVFFPGVDDPLIIPVDIATGPNWFEVEEIKCVRV